ncbi:hypothetical protein PRIPAC_96928 [Pristionchus pacificus]|uniref:Uncharacterized protein n=1 Tax=Pristionchus pacificus TaxID=54126 RepID=A0A2A6B343_PRIPA|nr:hypothetical protein PRIPAC_96928 [Pristionchus pacificus]|eukprot:PDM60306.1 hypothetical protein PRIPAC_54131 [Pristionchus pacificus]
MVGQKKIELEVHGFALDCATIPSFEPMQKLRILNTISLYSEKEFLDLVKQRHMLLEIPSISAYIGQQSVHFSANSILMDRFLLDIGIQRMRKAVLQLNDFSEFKLIKPSNTGVISPSLFSIEFEGRVRITLDYSAPVRVAITRNEN